MIYPISGFDVEFPHQPYGVQFSFMSKMLTALEQGNNALLEAPTGSGKTLSLLCSSLAWQARHQQRMAEEEVAQRALGTRTPLATKQKKQHSPPTQPQQPPPPTTPKQHHSTSPSLSPRSSMPHAHTPKSPKS